MNYLLQRNPLLLLEFIISHLNVVDLDFRGVWTIDVNCFSAFTGSPNAINCALIRMRPKLVKSVHRYSTYLSYNFIISVTDVSILIKAKCVSVSRYMSVGL